MVTSIEKHSENGETPKGQPRAKQQGRRLDDSQVSLLLSYWDSDMSLNQIAEATGFSYYTVNKYLKSSVTTDMWKARVKRMRQLHAYRHTDIALFKHPNWEGGMRLGDDGYVEVVRPEWYPGKHRYMHYHRMYYCMFNGMVPLPPDIDVHHVNGNKLDNRLENLRALTKSEHARLHHMLKV